MPLSIPFRNLSLSVKTDLAKKKNAPLLLLGHGANGGMEHPLIESAAKELAVRGVSVIRFNFPYTEEGKKSPNSDTVLEECWDAAVKMVRESFPKQPLFIGGKSLGGRTAAQYRNSFRTEGIPGLVFLGFPLHAPGRRSAERGNMLIKTELPCFLAQGSRDALADIDLIRKLVSGNKKMTLHVVEGGDHSLRRGKSGSAELPELWNELSEWIRSR